MGTWMLECGCSISNDMFQHTLFILHVDCDCKEHKDVFDLMKGYGDLKNCNLKRPRGIKITDITFELKGKKKQ